MTSIALVVALLLGLMPLCFAYADEWPSRPIEFIVPAAPGGGTDVTVRAIAPFLEKYLGCSIVVNNISGSGGVEAYTNMGTADPDGYTMGLIAMPAVPLASYGGREELTDTVSGLIDYGSLMVLALQRAKTAREAIQVMTDLTEKYGYESEGESFTIADPNEAWIMDMIGKGPGNKGTVWVAVRIPDDCISGHANQSHIHQFPLKDKKNCLYA